MMFQVKYILSHNISIVSILSFVMVTEKKKTPEIKRDRSQLKHFPYLHFHKFISDAMCFSKTALSA